MNALIRMKAIDKIPREGSISAKELAPILNMNEEVLSACLAAQC
jgi:hypothetical protein